MNSLVVFVLALSAAAACVQGLTVVKVAVVKDELPFTSYDEEKGASGFDVDLLSHIFDQHPDYELSFEPRDSIDEALEAVRQGTVDIAADGIFLTEDDTVLFTEPYFDDLAVVVVAEGNEEITTTDDLAGKVVGFRESTEFEGVAAGLEGVELKSFKGFEEIVNAVAQGDIDAAIDTRYSISLGISSGTLEGVKVVGEDLATLPLAFAVKTSEPALVDRINEQLPTVFEDGTFESLFRKHFGEEFELPQNSDSD